MNNLIEKFYEDETNLLKFVYNYEEEILLVFFNGDILKLDFESEKELAKFETEIEDISAFDIFDSVIFIGDEYGNCFMMNYENENLVHEVEIDSSAIVEFENESKQNILIGTINGKVIIYDKIMLQVSATYEFEDSICYLKELDEQKCFIQISDNEIIILNTKTKEIENEFDLGKFPITTIRIFDSDIFWGCSYGKLNYVNLNKYISSKMDVRWVYASGEWINVIEKFNNYLITGDDEGKVLIWDLESLEMEKMLRESQCSIIASIKYENYIIIGSVKSNLIKLDINEIEEEIEKEKKQKEEEKEKQRILEENLLKKQKKKKRKKKKK